MSQTTGTASVTITPDVSKVLPYRGPHLRDHLRSVRVFGRQYLWTDPGTGVLRLVPDPEGQAKLDRARAAVSRVWQPGL